MKALLIVTHGSRDPHSNAEVAALCDQILLDSENSFDLVRPAFLQFAEQDFFKQMDGLTEDGATEVVVLPLFIAAGSHVKKDIPDLVTAAAMRYPDIEIQVMPHLARFSGLARFIINSLTKNPRW